MRRKISQRTARLLKQRVHELETRVKDIHSAGVYLTEVGLSSCPTICTEIKTARRLGFKFYATFDDTNLCIYAVKP